MLHLKTNETNEQSLIDQVCQVLEDGGLLLFPTETTYGAGVDATNQAAVDKLLKYKRRREGKPLSIAVADMAAAAEFVEINEAAAAIYRQFLPGPVTVVSNSIGKVANGVASEFGTVGVRIPDYDLMLKICRQFGKPITATSANASGKKRPYSIQDVFDHISGKQKNLIDCVIDAGTLPPNEPSTVIDTTASTPITMRPGSLQLTENDSTQTQTVQTENETRALAGKLMLKKWNELKETGLIIGLEGDLGAGKTSFTKGIAEFLQISEPITSPTYTYLESYSFLRHGFSGELHHLDVWKIDSREQLQLLNLPQLLQPGTVTVIEWWSQIATWWPEITEQRKLDYLVTLSDENTATDQTRHITITENAEHV